MSGVRGTAELRRVARLLREATPELRREMRQRVRKPVKSFEARVKAGMPPAMPDRYAGVLAASTKVNLSQALGGSGLGYGLVVSAKGKGELRDIAAVEDGILRHPVYGNRDNWVAQPVLGGFVRRAFEEHGRQVAKELEEAVDVIARKIEGG